LNPSSRGGDARTDRHTAVASSLGLPRINGLRGRAIDVAMRLVEVHGPDAVNVREIAAELETGSASLYYHFASKDELLAELAAAGFRRLQATLSTALTLDACGDGYLHFIRDHPSLYKVMYTERLLSQYSVARIAEQRAFEAFARALETLSTDDARGRDTAMAYWALGRGIGALTMAASRPGDPPTVELLDQILRGLAAIKGRSVARPEDLASGTTGAR
jgi:AcrR family transcriptional regulator